VVHAVHADAAVVADLLAWVARSAAGDVAAVLVGVKHNSACSRNVMIRVVQLLLIRVGNKVVELTN